MGEGGGEYLELDRVEEEEDLALGGLLGTEDGVLL